MPDSRYRTRNAPLLLLCVSFKFPSLAFLNDFSEISVTPHDAVKYDEAYQGFIWVFLKLDESDPGHLFTVFHVAVGRLLAVEKARDRGRRYADGVRTVHFVGYHIVRLQESLRSWQEELHCMFDITLERVCNSPRENGYHGNFMKATTNMSVLVVQRQVRHKQNFCALR